MRLTLDLWFAVVAVALVFSGITRSALAVFNKITNQPHSTPSKNRHQRVMRSVRVAAQRCWSRS
jgi:hypothetical protein